MKKYLSGLFAILLAIGFSAFTTISKSTVNKSTSGELYWFEGNAQNDADLPNVVPGNYIGFDTKANLLSTEFSDCIGEETPPFCAIGYTSGQVHSVSGGFEVNSTMGVYSQPAGGEANKIRQDDQQ